MTSTTCFFCSDEKRLRHIMEAKTMSVVRDGFPVSDGHSLIISDRHVSDFFDLNPDEVRDLLVLLRALRSDLLRDDPSIDGFNIGMNCGAAAGQTVMHFHAHLIPRRFGDTPNPRGGVRGVIPDRMSY